MALNLSTLGRPVEWLMSTVQNGMEVLRWGGLETGAVPSPYEVVETVPMYKLRRYFPPDGCGAGGASRTGSPVLLIHPMMMSANMWDVTRQSGAVGILHDAGLDPWVIDFGSPDEVEGGMKRTLADHVVALSQAIDTMADNLGCDVHLAGYSQGGMFAYQTAAYRKSRGVASLVTFGAPVDTLAGLPTGMPQDLASGVAGFMADHVFSRLDIQGWMARAGFQLLDPIKTAKARVEFLLQLHDREALLPREAQRRFLESEGWIAWSGPAIAELLKQFVAHNRMVTGGFAINEQLVTLTDITCPILAFVGEVDDIGQPAAVRGIRRAAPNADVYEYLLRCGHFGLVIGSKAARESWPTVTAWVRWISGDGPAPAEVEPMAEQPAASSTGGVAISSRVLHSLGEVSGFALTLARGAADALVAANKSIKTLAIETARTLPRLTRLGQVNDLTRISLGRVIDEQAEDNPNGEFLLFDGRVHTYQAVNQRIDNVVRGLIEVGVRQGVQVGVLMETRPSAMVAIAALSRLGAVGVLLPPDCDLVEAARLCSLSEIITGPTRLNTVLKPAEKLGIQVLVLGGGETRDLDLADDTDVIDMEQIDPATVELPGWYRPNPGFASDLAFIAFSAVRGVLFAKQISNYRWALSALGTASAAALSPHDTVYCLTPLHHESGLLVSLGGAVVGGARIALTRGLRPDRFVSEVRQYGVSVVTYSWAMLRDVLDDPNFALRGNHPIRLFIGSGMPTGLWHHVEEVFAPAHVVEFFATTDGQAVLANVSGAKVGSKGRPLPGAVKVELAAYDADRDLILEDEQGFVRRAEPNELGVLLAKPRGPVDPAAAVKRGVFAPTDTWISTEYLFCRDADGDYWLIGGRETTRGVMIRTERGPVFPILVNDTLGVVAGVDLAVTYKVEVEDRVVAISAITLRPGAKLTPSDLTAAMSGLRFGVGPDVICVVGELSLSASYRPTVGRLRELGIPEPGQQCWHFDDGIGAYRRLTAAARAGLAGRKTGSGA